MKKILNLFQKAVIATAYFAVLVQAVSPLAYIQVAYAQEATVTPTPTDTVAPTPTSSVTPTDTSTPTPTDTVTPTVDQTVTATPVPTDTTTPSVTPADTTVPTPTDTVAPTTDQQNNQPSSTNNNQNNNPSQAPPSTVTPTVTPSATPTPDTTDTNGKLNTTLLQNVSAPSLDLTAPTKDSSAVITTDKADYHPTDTAVISGTGFIANKPYTLEVTSTDAPAVDFTTTITMDANGAFVYAYQLDGNYRPNYTVYVKDGQHTVATTTFTDSASASVDQYSQCANGTGSGPTCSWTNGDLNNSNSKYYEGDATPQRLAIDDLTTGDHTVTIQYDTTKGGKHAYDFIADDKFSESWITNSDFCSSPLTNFASCSSATPVLSGVIPSDSNAAGHDTAQTARHFTIRNGSWVSGGILSGPTLVSGDYTSDSSTNIQLKFHVDTTTCLNKYSVGNGANKTDVCEVLITFGGHVSSQLDWGNGNSAVNISGSPYHVRIVELDGAKIGSRDNQMAANAVIAPSTLTVVKNTVGGDSTFAYTTTETNGGTNLSSSFSITTANGTGSASFSTLTPGTYTVSETAPSNGWSFTSLSCTATGTGSSVATSGSTATVTVGSTGGASISCTYTNTQQATIELKKAWVGTAGQTTLNIGTSAGGIQVTSVQTGANGATPLTTGAQTVNAGTYYVSESGGLTNYTASLACTDNGNTVTPGASNSLSVAAGHAVVCTFTNTRNTGTIEVKKVVDPTNDSGTFNLQIDGTTKATGGNGTTTNAVTVDTGTHAVSETAANSTVLSNYTSTYACTVNGQASVSGSGTTVSGLSVAKGDAVVCTFTNTLKRGTIIVKKTMVGGTGSFTFTGDVAGTISTDGGTLTTANVLPGTYTSVEGATTGWDLTSISCDDTDSTGSVNTATATFTVSAGETVTCTFTNTKKGHLIVQKTTNPANDTTSFTINATGSGTITGGGSGTVTDATDKDYEVTPGTYTVTETVPTGWQQDSNNCSNVAVATGQTVYCQIVNTKLGNVTVVKYLDSNANGTKDSGEQTLDTWEIKLGNMSQFTGAQVAGQVTFSDVYPNTYTLSETMQQGWNQSNISCTGDTGIDNSNSHTVVLGAGQNITCYIGNYQNATIHVTKVITDPDGKTATGDATVFPFAVGGSNDTPSLGNGNSHDFVVTPGQHTVSETLNSDYTFEGCDTGAATSNGTLVSVTSGQTLNVTCTNQQKKALVTIVKDVRDFQGNDVSDSTLFTVNQNGTDSQPFGEGTNATYTVNPGTYTYTENPVTSGYTLHSVSPDNDSNASNGTTITIGSNGTQTITFTNYQNPGTISGHKFMADGSTPIPGWLIKLYTCTASDFVTCVLGATTTTNANGEYSFSNLLTGFYKVVEDLVSTYTPMTATSHNVTVTPGSTTASQDFSNFKNINVTACKKQDADGNLTTTNDQTTVLGWTVQLLTDGNVTDTKTTGDNGCYTWTNLGPNHTYGVQEVVTSGWTALTDTSHNFGTAQDGVNDSYTFINFHNVSISGHKFDDLNGNGVKDGNDYYLSNWSIDLENTSGTVLATTTTDANGVYTFSNLTPGTYRVREKQQTGWTQTTTNPADITVSSGTDVSNVDFGNQGHGTITVHKDVDTDGDGVVDQTDVTTWNYDINGAGAYTTGSTQQVVAGTYTVSEEQKDGYHVTSLVCDNGLEYDPTTSFAVDVVAGQDLSCTFTNTRDTGTITVSKTVVPSDNSQWDMTIDGPTANGAILSDGQSSSTYTSVIGNYTVSEAAHTGYSLDDYIPSYVCTDGQGVVTSGDGTTANFTLVKDEDVTCAFTNTKKGSVVVTKFNDKNGNGVQDEGEEVLSDWTINLDESSQVTDANGQVTFNQVVPGDYQLSENIKDGWRQTNISCSSDTTGVTPTPTVSVSPTVTPTPTGTQSSNICHATGSKNHPWEAISVNANAQHTTSPDDFPYNGPVNPHNGKPTNAGDAWCAANQPVTPTPTQPLTSLLESVKGLFNITAEAMALILDNSNDHTVTVSAGQTVTCKIGNQSIVPVLSISKTNDKLGQDLHAGDSVTYTITVTATQSAVLGATLTDLLPKGFHYRAGSATIDLGDGNGAQTFTNFSDDYHSPGIWNLGNMSDGQTITLTLIADIDSSEQPGLYKDVAWAEGTSLADTTVLANAEPTGYVDTNFVGTQANVIASNQNGSSYNVTQTNTQEVLGASTELPDTGAQTYWLIFALSLLLIGGNSVIIGLKLKRREQHA